MPPSRWRRNAYGSSSLVSVACVCAPLDSPLLPFGRPLASGTPQVNQPRREAREIGPSFICNHKTAGIPLNNAPAKKATSHRTPREKTDPTAAATIRHVTRARARTLAVPWTAPEPEILGVFLIRAVFAANFQSRYNDARAPRDFSAARFRDEREKSV